MKAEGTLAPSQPPPAALGLGPPDSPSYHGNATGEPSTHVQHVESKSDDFGTTVTGVTTITTRKRY